MNVQEIQDIQILDNIDSILYKLSFFSAIFPDSAFTCINELLWNRDCDS